MKGIRITRRRPHQVFQGLWSYMDRDLPCMTLMLDPLLSPIVFTSLDTGPRPLKLTSRRVAQALRRHHP
jgi:hypothetical protein